MIKRSLAAVVVLLFAESNANASCNSDCKKQDYPKGGKVVGTAPSCEASCDDCDGKHCVGNISDGNGCWTGNKVCCCVGETSAETARA